MSWYIRGSKPERNVEAAAWAWALGLVEAIAGGKPRPWLHAGARALASAAAMSEHRLRDRARANENYSKLADRSAEVVAALLDRPTTQPGAHPALAVPSPYGEIVTEWNRVLDVTGRSPSTLHLPGSQWRAMSARERKVLIDAAARDGVELLLDVAS